MFGHVTESKWNLKPFFKPKLKPNIFLLNWVPDCGRDPCEDEITDKEDPDDEGEAIANHDEAVFSSLHHDS